MAFCFVRLVHPLFWCFLVLLALRLLLVLISLIALAIILNRKRLSKIVKRSSLVFLALFGVSAIVFIIIYAIVNRSWEYLWVNLIVIAVVAWLLSLSSVRKLLKQEAGRPRYYVRYYAIMLSILPFSVFLLLQTKDNSLPEVLQYGMVGVASTLGGLVFTAAQLFNKQEPLELDKYYELVAIAQKFILATIAFIFFAPLVFLDGLLVKGLSDQSYAGFSKAVAMGLHWLLQASAGILFYGGLFIFILGLVDLVIALNGLGRRPPKKTSDTADSSLPPK